MYIKDFATKTGLSIDTLRYYEEEELLIPARNEKNYRVYTEEDYCWVQLLLKMKQTGMTITNIKNFAALQKQGDKTLPNRIQILDNHMENLYEQQKDLAETISFVAKKVDGYREKL
ncbi:TPA: MerR family transcriptional regulator [Listeria monocytogenes]|uniref:MerR family transcriptional regulator n=3 Tax=Listeria monocytogenes TaxID=1639 RepID=A0A393IQ47_LISMN|nr:MerR family transcriptional regulator [Listeria monocytogenes]EAA0166615.1 MerR family transcriptional regulator [Listeria monocytogenes serotype 1/2a]EAE6023305.1 MerR family transcriptional regulator [Listeria monocytogenes serotype 3a]EAF4501578.1 MerR family transcriptional regulator [Listeria monocytogenes serotype 4b]EAG6255991.1 MerR family transcriptional regulator [Listeria monocytogenes CFSAN003807]EAG6282621.1 MerR family transcriptional regulator [Listeria monocytogenes CFSAN003